MTVIYDVYNFSDVVIEGLVSDVGMAMGLAGHIGVGYGPMPANPRNAGGALLDANVVRFNLRPASGGMVSLAGPVVVTNNSGQTRTPAWAVMQGPNTHPPYNNAQATLLLSIGTEGSGAGVIVSSTAPVNAGGTLTISDFSVKVPLVLGTARLSMNLADALANYVKGGATLCRLGYGDNSYPSKITIYSGTPPNSADVAVPAGQILGTYTVPQGQNIFSRPPYSGSCILAGPKAITASGTGTATFFRLTKVDESRGTFVLQGTVATDNSADATLSSVNFVSGSTYNITALGLRIV